MIGFFLAFALAVQTPSPDDTAPDPEAGHLFAEAHCASCHAIGPTGQSPVRRAVPFRNLHEKYEVEGLGESLAEGIVVGDPMMPEHVLKAEQIVDLIAYLKTLEIPGGQSASPAR